MACARLGHLGTLLLVLWLTADATACGFCMSSIAKSLPGTAFVSIGGGNASQASPLIASPDDCFCCSVTTELSVFQLAVDSCAAWMSSTPRPTLADNCVAKTSPPPRL